ncbi:hypothetical protein RFI_05613 [Reticulomyxa filosa]|uniref:Uncharacterized protein n=1 Tax=Reticulomyxa filosa TaxID=46433 RepID=X6P1S9_RETFI|nr:hypothetical protein RFI_05613 [Reticulomyxa filosa]|eukprot:ETO31507.1 hypothetical protein RFI_05613 [Reticulomyxa filosa]
MFLFRKVKIWHQIENISKVNKVKQASKKEEISKCLDFKNHWNKHWRKSNAEAAKTVKQMLQSNEQGLIIVAYNTLKWKNRNDNLSSIVNLLKNNKDDIKEFKEYIMCIIKKKEIVLEEVNIDGNVYAVNCKIECKGHVNITTQLFVTNNAIIDQQLKQTISPIEWNTKIHHDIPVQLQDLENMGEECISKKLFDDSLSHLQKYLRIAIDTFGFSHHYVAIAYNLIANIYNDNKRQHEKAIEFYEKALKTILHIFGNNCNFVAKLYENFGYANDRQKRYDKAIEYYTKSLEIKLAIFGDNHVDTSWSYDNLGDTYQMKIEYDKAIECYEKALKIKLEIFGINFKATADSYSKIGCVYQCKNEYDKAIEYNEKSLKIRLEVFGDTHDNVAYSYQNLGVCYTELGQYNKAIEFHEKALKIMLDIFGINHDDVACLYTNLGIAYENSALYEKAVECYENALKIRKGIFGNINSDVADSYWNLGLLFEAREHNKMACKYFEDAWQIYSTVFGEWNGETLQAKERAQHLGKST